LLSERSVYFKDNLAIKTTLDKNVYKKEKKQISLYQYRTHLEILSLRLYR